MKSISSTLNGRAKEPISKAELENLFLSLWTEEARDFPMYPKVLGGVVCYYEDGSGNKYAVESLDELLEKYSEEATASIAIEGQINSNPLIIFAYVCAEAEAQIVIEASSTEIIQKHQKEFKKYFPLEPLTRIDRHLLQRGYEFDRPKQDKKAFQYREYLKKSARFKYKEGKDPVEYSKFFESFIADVLLYEFGLNVGLNYKIKNEGDGGDFDVLTLNNALELFDFECKSGNNLDTNDVKQILIRRDFLKPYATFIIFDQSKKRVEEMLKTINTALTEYTTAQDPSILTTNPNWKYLDPEPILAKGYTCAYHINRAIFICDGENIKKSIAHCLRYYEGVEKRRAYYSK